MKIIEIGLRERDKAQIGLKWPLASTNIKGPMKIGKELKEVIMNQLNVKSIKFVNEKELSVEFDTKMSPELEAEGYAREISRKVQAARKNLGLVKKDIIKLAVVANNYLKNLIEGQKEFIKERTNAKYFSIETESPRGFEKATIVEDKIKGKEIKILIKKV